MQTARSFASRPRRRPLRAAFQHGRSLLLAFAGCLTLTALHAQEPEPHLRSKLFVYDLRDGSSHLVYTADSLWEAPNWSPDGKYLLANHDGGLYSLTLQPDGTAQPHRLALPAAYLCNNDKALSPEGRHLAFSATPPAGAGVAQGGSQFFVANADGTHPRQITHESPSYFHGWSPDGQTLAFVAQRGGTGQFDIYTTPLAGGSERRLTEDPHHDDGPDYAPDGHWIYINSDRSGKEAIWRLPPEGAGPHDTRAQQVLSDTLEDWFPHPSPDGTKLVYIGYPAGTPTHNPRNVAIQLKLVTLSGDAVVTPPRTLVSATGGQGSLNVNSWAPDSQRFAYITYEALP